MTIAVAAGFLVELYLAPPPAASVATCARIPAAAAWTDPRDLRHREYLSTPASSISSSPPSSQPSSDPSPPLSPSSPRRRPNTQAQPGVLAAHPQPLYLYSAAPVRCFHGSPRLPRRHRPLRPRLHALPRHPLYSRRPGRPRSRRPEFPRATSTIGRPEFPKITPEMIDQAAALAAIVIPAEDKAAMLDHLNQQRGSYIAIRKLDLPNSVAPAFVFDPLPPAPPSTPSARSPSTPKLPPPSPRPRTLKTLPLSPR